MKTWFDVSSTSPIRRTFFKSSFSCKEDIEKQLSISEPIEWMELPGKKASRIKATFGFRFRDTATWESAFAWLTETVLRFKRVFTRSWQRRNNPQTTEDAGITVSQQS